MKGIPWHVFPTAFSSCPSALSRDSSSAKTNETQALMSHCKNSLRDKVKRGGFVRIQREATLQGVNHCQGQGLVRFCEGGNSYANEWEDHPSVGEPPLGATPGCVCQFIDWGLST